MTDVLLTLLVSLMLLFAAPASASGDLSSDLPDFTGSERPGLLMLDGVGVFRYIKIATHAENVRTFNRIGEDFLDLETALLPADVAAEKPQMTIALIRAMDGWKNEYQKPWSVASYGGPLTLKTQLQHTLRINIGLTLYHPSFGYSSQRLEEIVYRLKGSDPTYLPCVRSSGASGDYLVIHEINIAAASLDCEAYFMEWFRLHVSELAGMGWVSAVGELFAWYHSPYYEAGDLPPEMEKVIRHLGDPEMCFWKGDPAFRYDGFDDLEERLLAMLARVNSGWVPDSSEAKAANFDTRIFMLITGRL